MSGGVWRLDPGGMSDAVELPDVERVAADVHEAWRLSKFGAGIYSRRSESGEELMEPYSELSEAAKELDRTTVRAVYRAMGAVEDRCAACEGDDASGHVCDVPGR